MLYHGFGKGYSPGTLKQDVPSAWEMPTLKGTDLGYYAGTRYNFSMVKPFMKYSDFKYPNNSEEVVRSRVIGPYYSFSKHFSHEQNLMNA